MHAQMRTEQAIMMPIIPMGILFSSKGSHFHMLASLQGMEARMLLTLSEQICLST